MSSIPPPPTVPPTVPPPPGGGSYTPPPPSGHPGEPQSSDRTIMLVLSYLGPLGIVPLLMKNEDREVQWHAKNGLVIFAAEVILVIVLSLLGNYIPGMGCITGPIFCVIPLAFLAITVFAIVKATQGQRLRIPLVSDFADKF